MADLADEKTELAEGPVLVIDTSYGLTVGLVGQDPLYEEDSRSHVERISPLVSQALAQAGLRAEEVRTIVVGVGPAPFTGLRAGIVSAKAFAFATGASLVGQDVLEPQAWWVAEQLVKRGFKGEQLVLAVNDARRKQLYYQLFLVRVNEQEQQYEALSEMDIQYPEQIVPLVLQQQAAHPGLALSLVGHGAQKYFGQQSALATAIGAQTVEDSSVVHWGARGLAIFASQVLDPERVGSVGQLAAEANPLYLRRPDVSLPLPLKPVLPQVGPDAEPSEPSNQDNQGKQPDDPAQLRAAQAGMTAAQEAGRA